MISCLLLDKTTAQFFDDFDNAANCPSSACLNTLDNGICMPNWAVSHGTPHIFTSINQNLGMIFNTNGTEGAFRNYSFSSNTFYRLSFDYRTNGSGDFPPNTTHDPINLVIQLTSGLAHNPGGAGW